MLIDGDDRLGQAFRLALHDGDDPIGRFRIGTPHDQGCRGVRPPHPAAPVTYLAEDVRWNLFGCQAPEPIHDLSRLHAVGDGFDHGSRVNRNVKAPWPPRFSRSQNGSSSAAGAGFRPMMMMLKSG